jgi:peroxiredoxin
MGMKPVYKLAVGDDAPDFELMATGDAAGKGATRKKIKLSDYRGKKNVVLAFFPAAFTPV